MIISDTIKQRLISELKLDEYSHDAQQKIVEEMVVVITQRTLGELISTLPEEKRREELIGLVEVGDMEPLQEFIKQNIPNFETIARDATADEIRIFLKAQENDFKE